VKIGLQANIETCKWKSGSLEKRGGSGKDEFGKKELHLPSKLDAKVETRSQGKVWCKGNLILAEDDLGSCLSETNGKGLDRERIRNHSWPYRV